jgi:hypothetical protein
MRWSSSPSASASQAERIEQTELFLAELERRSSPAGGNAPRKAVPGYSRAQELTWIDALLQEKSWLYKGEIELLGRMREQVQGDRSLSDGQLAKLRRMRETIDRRRGPHFVPGGLPSLGKGRP